MGLQNLDDSPQEVVVGTKSFMCSPLRVRHLAQVKRYLADQRPNPIKLVMSEMEGLTEKQQDMLLAKAYDDRLRMSRVSDLEADEFMNGIEGTAYVLWLCARDCNPAVAIDEVNAAIDAMGVEDLPAFAESLEKAMGRMDRPTLPPATTALAGNAKTRRGSEFTSSYSRKKAGRRRST